MLAFSIILPTNERIITMNSAYIYLQIYRLFDKTTPLKFDCGKLCNSACCEGDESGMYLFPGEDSVYRLLNCDWATIEKSDFTYSHNGKTKNVPLLVCKGKCDRYERPLACRIFPLTPYVGKDGKLQVIMDPRAKSVCPIAKELDMDELPEAFSKRVKKAFLPLMKNAEFRAFMKTYSEYLDEFQKFF